MRYRKKPMEVDAFQYNNNFIDKDGRLNIPNWIIKAFDTGILYYSSIIKDTPPHDLFIRTLEKDDDYGLVLPGDYIVRNIMNGEIFRISSEIFEDIYEKID